MRADFDGGEDATPDSPLANDAWDLPEIGWPGLRVHPLHVLDAEDLALIELWLSFRSGGAGPGPLPFAGGLADQPACVIAAFGVIGGAANAVRPRLGAGPGSAIGFAEARASGARGVGEPG